MPANLPDPRPCRICGDVFTPGSPQAHRAEICYKPECQLARRRYNNQKLNDKRRKATGPKKIKRTAEEIHSIKTVAGAGLLSFIDATGGHLGVCPETAPMEFQGGLAEMARQLPDHRGEVRMTDTTDLILESFGL